VPEGGEFVVRIASETIWGASILSFFKARFALFRQSLVDMRPPALLVVVLQFCRCLLRLESSLLTSAWSSRARGFVTPWAARDDHAFVSVAVLGGVRGFWCSVAAGDISVAERVVSDDAFFRRQLLFLGVFLFLNTNCI
jgi:hypothetical protein